ncbi:MAG: hypothetical protein WCK01_04835 [Candidatus Uhrbacteria bacterium]
MPVVSIGASAVRTDFSYSWAKLVHQSNEKYVVTIHVENTGVLASKDAKLALILSSGWKYKGTKGKAGVVTTSDKPYGQLVEWQLNSISGGRSLDIDTSLSWPGTEPAGAIFLSVSSLYSVPVYTQIYSATSSEKVPVWSSWYRPIGAYISLTTHEYWSRLIQDIQNVINNI